MRETCGCLTSRYLDDADPPLGPDFAQVVVDAPDDLDQYEVIGNPLAGDGYREFRVPAVVVNGWADTRTVSPTVSRTAQFGRN